MKGNLVVLGDLNARTANNLDHVHNDTNRFIPESIPYDIDNNMSIRNNQDKILNDRGSNLLDLCISTRLRILNGRKPGDSIGYYTCHKYNGSSVVDYCLVTECIFQDIFMYIKI
jgi:hypothetical protein